jgi:hypothetical protein
VALIYAIGHPEDMFGIVLIASLVIIALLAPLYGADSRIDEAARRRRLGH